MPQEVFNEGRVVGMSAYELYLRHQMSEYPELEPLTEREWLASTIGNGCSMIMRIPKGTPAGIIEKQLPDNSTLCAASNITACVFDGQVELDAAGTWATRVMSYGPLISNTSNSHPSSPGDSMSTVPVGVPWSKETHAQLKEYMKIVDGLVYQPGEWEENSSDDSKPHMDFKSPNFHKRSIVRFNISKALESDVYIIITGWIHGTVLSGSTKLDAGALDLIHPWNGDFLGAERFPWAVKVVLTVPTGLMHVLNDKAYIRELATGSANKAVTAKAIVDMDSVDLQSFYNSNDVSSYPQNVSTSKVAMNVTELNVIGDGAAVIGAYQRRDITQGGLTGVNYPPILYGSKVTNAGQQHMVPIDVGAPGTVKIFNSKDRAINYPKIIPNTYALWHDKANKDMYFVEGDTVVPMNTRLKTQNLGSASAPKFTSIATCGNTEIRSISLTDDRGNNLNTAGTGGTVDVSNKNLTWTDLLSALGANKAIDLIGTNLREFRNNLPNIVSGAGGVLEIKGTGQSKIAGNLSVAKSLSVSEDITGSKSLSISGHSTLSGGTTIKKGTSSYHIQSTDNGPITFNKPIRSGTNYIEFDQGSNKDPLRLYLSATQPDPSTVPVGSIGIGW